MANRDQIVEFCNDTLDLHRYHDYGPMGLQFTGQDEVKKIFTAVSISVQNIRRAAYHGANMMIVHHGLFWNNESHEIDERNHARLTALEEYRMSLLGYHLALDAHPKIGNNILAARALGLGKLTPWQDIGWSGEYKQPMRFEQFVQKATVHIPQRVHHHSLETIDPILYFYGPDEVQRVAVIVGGAAHYIVQAKKDGFDTFVTGEAAEPTLALAQDYKMNFLAFGHDATEQSGVQHLGRMIQKKFKVQTEFVDAWNPV